MPLLTMDVAARTRLALTAPSTPLGPFQDSFVSWTTWVTLMGFVGLVVLSLSLTGPVCRVLGSDAADIAVVRLTRVATVIGLLAAPAVVSDTALGLGSNGGYDYAAAWNTVNDGSNDGRLLGIEITMIVVGLGLLAPLTIRRVAAGRWQTGLLVGALVAGAVSLGTTKFPTATPAAWSRTIFDTGLWVLHLGGGAVWIGGLVGLLVLALPGAVSVGHRGAFFSTVIRRFSIIAMSCVAAITLSGLWLYWGHVDGPTQLLTTMYGRVLGVKILIFGTMLLLGVVNQFWLHPRIDALRAGGDDPSPRNLLARKFPAVIAVEVVLGLAVLMAAPFLHGSARNQAFQAEAAEQAGTELAQLPKIPAKTVTATTWVWGVIETVVVVGSMVVAYRVSGRIADRRAHQRPANTKVPESSL